IACGNCRLVVRYFCERCNTPVHVGSKFCTKCGEINKEYNPRYDSNPRTDQKQKPAEKKPVDIDAAFDAKSKAVAKEIAELKATLSTTHDQSVLGSNKQPKERVIMQWHSDVVLHSKGRGNVIHIGFGTDPEHAKGVPGMLFFTESRLVFFSYLVSFENVSGILAYFTAELQRLTAYDFNPDDMHRNYLAFENHGILKRNFPEARAIMVNFSWSKDPERGNAQSQSFIFKSMMDRVKGTARASTFPGGDYLFLVSTPRDDPQVTDVLVELESVQELRENIRQAFKL
nr:zinc ribbon domain-containing protein [Candidatus Sigynarchaeota archaeon]